MKRQVVVLEIGWVDEDERLKPKNAPADWHWPEMLNEPEVRIIAAGPVSEEPDEDEVDEGLESERRVRRERGQEGWV